MNNRFVILIGSYNNEQWVAQNLESVLSQTHKNFRIIYYDAKSTDNTARIVEQYTRKDPRIVYHTSPERCLKSWFLSEVEEWEPINDNDIVCVLDGDDFLANEDVLAYLNEVYNKTDCWMTYGGMIVWNGGESTQEAFPQNSEAPPEVKQNKLYRQDLWRYSHFRTCRGFLWKKVKKQDLISTTDGQYMTLEDLVLMYAFLEMCPSNKIFRVDENIYIWNNSTANASRGCAENKVNNIGVIYENEIRRRPKYNELAVVSPTLAGGLGNQMFEVAAAASLAVDNKALLVVNPNEHILPNQGRNVNTYTNNIFSRVILDKNPPINARYSWDRIGYSPIPFSKNMKLGGHYQSFKYFHHNRGYIRGLFYPTDEVRTHIMNTFGPIMADVTAVQVRRGDYYKFPDHHPLLTPNYYANAIKLAQPKEVWVFSDDTKWCQENLSFDCPVRYVKDEDYIELYVMSFCKNVIISNSSFGWWAAYLNNRPDTNVYVPATWFGKALIADGFKMEDLVLPEWNRVEL
jgi:glycosyltransferase involved in cell wall biosynthesis